MEKLSSGATSLPPSSGSLNVVFVVVAPTTLNVSFNNILCKGRESFSLFPGQQEVPGIGQYSPHLRAVIRGLLTDTSGVERLEVWPFSIVVRHVPAVSTQWLKDRVTDALSVAGIDFIATTQRKNPEEEPGSSVPPSHKINPEH